MRKKVGGFYDACLPTGWLIHVVIKSSFAVTMRELNRYALQSKAAEHMGRIKNCFVKGNPTNRFRPVSVLLYGIRNTLGGVIN
ncbi:MAG: hypothetical protein IJP31_06465 [Lachnospiraceae bacterium]|nr:hypothetical protein [Lachnospiraceae bacterium]